MGNYLVFLSFSPTYDAGRLVARDGRISRPVTNTDSWKKDLQFRAAGMSSALKICVLCYSFSVAVTLNAAEVKAFGVNGQDSKNLSRLRSATAMENMFSGISVTIGMNAAGKKCRFAVTRIHNAFLYALCGSNRLPSLQIPRDEFSPSAHSLARALLDDFLVLQSPAWHALPFQ